MNHIRTSETPRGLGNQRKGGKGKERAQSLAITKNKVLEEAHTNATSNTVTTSRLPCLPTALS